MERRGIFISLEGIEGAGKSTVLHHLRVQLQARGRELCTLREPGGTVVGEHIRAMLLDPDTQLHARAELLLFSASRAQLVETVIRPALARGAVVISDRFTDSSLAYQGAARGLGLDVVRAINTLTTAGLVPDRTILIDLPAEEGLRRAAMRRSGDGHDRFEAQNLAFHQKIRATYLQLAEAEPERFRVVDGVRPASEVARLTWAAMADLMDIP